MRRTPTSALLALYPAFVVVAVSFVSEAVQVPAGDPGSLGAFVREWWLAVVVVSVLAHSLGFIWHALARSAKPAWERALWALGLLFASPFAAPLYWWRVADAI